MSSQSAKAMSVFENLEERVLFKKPHASEIISDYLDNRGQGFFTVSVALDTSTLSRKTAAIYIAGNDGVVGTGDDVRAYTHVGYRRGRLSVRADLALDQPYRIILNASVIKDVNGHFLDGEFNGDLRASGDGVDGGNYDVMTQPAAKTRARFSTAAGYINVGLYRNTPNTKSNFVTYVNGGDYDATVFHRMIKAAAGGIDIVQGGGFTLDRSTNTTGTVASRGNINNEGANLNARGTLAMANAGANTNNSQWFFNVKSNTGLDQPPGTYTVFGGVLDVESQNTLDAMLTLETSGPSPNGNYPLAGVASFDVPVRSIQAIIDRQNANPDPNFNPLSPKDDLITVDRVAMLMDVVAPPGGARRALAAAPAPLPAPVAVRPAASPFLAIKDQKDSLLD